MHLNRVQAQQNGFVTDLKPGDKVRVDDTSLFQKGTESRWSDEAHVVQSASGKSVTLTDGTTHRRSKVLMIPENTVVAPNTEKNVIKVATKKHKEKSYFEREGIDEANVIQCNRNRFETNKQEHKRHLTKRLLSLTAALGLSLAALPGLACPAV